MSASYFTPTTRVVQLDAENSVVIRKITGGKRKRVLGAATTATLELGADGEEIQHITVNPFLMQLETIVACVAEWHGPRFDGKPVTRVNIEELPEEELAVLEAEIERLNAGLSAAEKN